MELTEKARLYAMAVHGEQKYGQEPYIVHLTAVVNTLLEFGWNDPNLIAAAYLHDVVEDTSVTLEELSKHFPIGVTYIVDGVTSVPGPNRKIRNAATYPRIAEDDSRRIVKLADRIANVRQCLVGGSKSSLFSFAHLSSFSLYSMYHKEYPGFHAALYTDNPNITPMWAELNKLMQWSSTRS